MKMKKKNKKGNIEDPITAIFILLGVVMTLFIVNNITDGFGTAIKGNNATNISSITNDYDTFNSRLVAGWDYGVLFLMLGFIAFSYIASRRILVDDKTMIIAFFVFVFFFFIAMLVSNLHGRMLDNSTYSSFIDSTTFIKYIMPNLLWYSMIHMFIVAIGLFTKGDGRI